MADVKPDIKPDISEEKIQVTVNFNEQVFKFAIKPTTVLKKVFDSTEKQVSAQTGTLRFMIEGVRVQPQHTLAFLHENHDIDLDDVVLDANVEQIGGSFVDARQ